MAAFVDTFNQGPAPFDPSDPNSSYSYFSLDASNFANDGVVIQDSKSVTLRARPFTKTFPLSDFGGMDHVKTLQYAKQFFSPEPKKTTLRYELEISGETFGTEYHPFPDDAVTNSQDDIRLAGVAMTTLDQGTWMVFDFILTNEGIWALYERLPVGRDKNGPLGFYRAFTSTKRVGSRLPTDVHKLAIEYDKAAKEIRWYVEKNEVLVVNNIGVPVTDDPDFHIVLDHGGVDTTVEPVGFSAGFALFTLLDMTDPNNSGSQLGLVKLNSLPDFYVVPSRFHDAVSEESSRLFGQGAQITVRNMKVKYE